MSPGLNGGKCFPMWFRLALLLLGTSLGTVKWFNEASVLSVVCMLSDCKLSVLTRTH